MTFAPRAALVWAFGDFDNPELQLNGVDDYGVEWWMENPAGWTKLAAQVPADDLPAPRDGAVSGTGKFQPRVLNIRGGFRGPVEQLDDAEDRFRDAIEKVAVAGTISLTEPKPKQASFKLTGDYSVDFLTRRARTFSAVLTCHDPLKYAAGAAGLVATTPMRLLDTANLPGITFPLEFPSDFGGTGVDPSVVRLGNPGRLPVKGLLQFRGNMVDPRVTLLSTGEYFGISGTVTAAADVDLLNRSVMVDGVSRFSRKQPGSSFFALPKKMSDLRFTASAYSPLAAAQLIVRPTWR